MHISGREKGLMTVILILLLSNVYFIYINNWGQKTVLTPETIDSIFVEEEEEDKSVVVYVTGQVKSKGVVCLQEGDRVIDAINAAGGPTGEADLDRINLAELVTDEKWIYVPYVGEEINHAVIGSIGREDEGKVNINTASASEIERLPGIGPVLAGRIVDFREKRGPFGTPEDIMKVSGIGPRIYESIKDSISVK